MNSLETLITKPLQSGLSKADTSLKRILFPGPARLVLPEFTSVKRTKKDLEQRIKNYFTVLTFSFCPNIYLQHIHVL